MVACCKKESGPLLMFMGICGPEHSYSLWVVPSKKYCVIGNLPTASRVFFGNIENFLNFE